MARRSDHTRDELYGMALAAAREISEKDGLRGLTARRIARRIGYSVGTLYNLFEDMDDLILHLNGSTLDALYEACAGERLEGEPEAALQALAQTYIRFTSDHLNLWNVVFDYRLPNDQQAPDWYHQKVRRLEGLVEGAVAPLFPPDQANERLHSARVLWASLYGICSVVNTGKVAIDEAVARMADSLVTNYLAGLRARQGLTDRASRDG